MPNNKSSKRYVIHEQRKSGKTDRFSVFDTQEKREVKGKLDKETAINLYYKLNGKPRQKKKSNVLRLQSVTG